MRLKKGCCCYSLQDGAIIIGITFMMASSVALLMEVGLIAEWEDVKLSLHDKRMRQFTFPVLIVGTVLSAVYILFSVLMLHGVKMENKLYILPWLVWSFIHVTVTICACIYELTLGGTVIELTVVPMFYVVVICFWIYSVVCVLSYYKTLSRRRNVASVYNRRTDQTILISLHDASSPRVYPQTIWEDSTSSVSSVGVNNNNKRRVFHNNDIYRQPGTHLSQQGLAAKQQQQINVEETNVLSGTRV